MTFRKLGLIPLLAVLVAVFTGVVALAGLTADEILDRVEEERDLLAERDLISVIRFDNTFSDGTTAYNLFGSLSKTGKSLVYFQEPEDVQGALFLTVDRENEDSRLWLYLPLLGLPKELISEEARGSSFAGSTLSYEDLGGDDRNADYDADLVGEDTLTVGELSRPVYIIRQTAKPQANVDYLTAKTWVDKEYFIVLKSEATNELGKLEQTMDVLMLGEFEGSLTADQITARDVLKGSSTTISFLDRRRPAGEIPNSVFDPDNLASFDPSTWGFDG
jgi:hypothetical protein